MFDAKQLLDQFLGAPVPGTSATVKEKAGDLARLAQENPLATGAIAAVLLGTGFGRRLTGDVVQIGGLAAIAGLGYRAWQNYRNGAAPAAAAPSATPPQLAPPPAGSDFAEGSPAHTSDFALVLVKAMIAAARADGQIDAAEQAIILDKVKLSGLGPEAEAFLNSEMTRPLDIDELVSHATTEAQKVELYTASRLTINPDTRAERGYLDLLAGRLGLPDDLIIHIEATVSTANA
nr:tellurite resistance TerB family protein [uncultured Gellertiella sp.]